MRSLNALAWRNLKGGRTRTILSVLTVALGAAMIVAGDVIASAIFSAHQKSDAGQNVEFFAEMFDFGLGVVGVAILVAAGFLVFNAFAMAITQRKRQIGALRSLGMTRRQVMQLVLVEALLTGGIGTLLGLVVGPLLGGGLIALLEWAGELLDTTLAVFGEPSVSLSSFATATALGVGITLISVWIPARQATRISPLIALREQVGESASLQGGKSASWQVVVGLAVAVALMIYLIVVPPGEWVYPPWDTILSGLFTLVWLACLGLILPALVNVVADLARKFLSRWWGATGRLVADNLRRNRRRVILTILTLAVGLTMIVSMTGLISFMFSTLLGRMIESTVQQDGWLMAPLDVTADMTAAFGEMDLETMHVPPDLAEKAREVVGDRAAVGEWTMVVVPELSFLPGWNSYIGDAKELPDLGAYGFTFTEGDWETALPIMKSGCGILMTPLVARNNGVWLGDTFTVQGRNGPVVCTVAGLGSHPVSGNASFISVAARDSFVPEDRNPTTVIVAPYPGVDREQLDAELDVLLDGIPNVWPNRVAPLMESAGGAGDSLTSVMNSMLLLAILAATLGVVNTTMMNVHERRRELGLLRAVGATRRQVIAVVTGEVALMGFIGGVVGLVAGVGITVVFATTYGGNAWGVPDLSVWDAAWEAAQRAMSVGLFGLIAAPFVSAWAARLPARSILRGSAIETMEAERQPEVRRPKRTRMRAFVWAMAWRHLTQYRLRTALSVLAVTLGVAMTIAGSVIGDSVVSAISNSEVARFTGVELFEQLAFLLTLVGVAVTAAAGFLVFNAFAMSVTQRRQQIGALRSLGMTRRQVLRLMLIEALITGGLGTSLGLVVGPLLGRGIIALLKTTGTFLNAFTEGSTSLSSFLLAAALGVGITLLSVLFPAWRATRVSPLDALRAPKPASIVRNPTGPARVGLAIVVGVVAYLLVAPPGEWVMPPQDSLLTGLFAVAWLTGLTLTLPALVGGLGDRVRQPLTRWLGAVGRLVADNLQRGRGRVTLTIATLAVGLTMIVGMSGFITFFLNELFGKTLESAVQQRGWVISSFKVTENVADFAELDSPQLAPEAVEKVEAVVNGRADVLAFYFALVPDLSFLGPNYFSFVLDPDSLRETGTTFFTFTEGDWETAMPIMESGCGLLLTPLVAQKRQVQVGDTLNVPGVAGDVECTVAGIGRSYVSASIISSTAGKAFGVTDLLSLYISPSDGASPAQLESDLYALADRHSDIHVMPLDDMAGFQEIAFDQVRATLNGLLLLAILAAALGVVNTTVMSVAERQRELGLLRAVGAIRRQVSAVIVGEAALMGLIGGGLGLVAGVGITVILVMVYGGNAFGLDLDLWATAWRVIRPALLNGLIGLVAAPFICAGAARLPARSILRGSTIETMEPERQVRRTSEVRRTWWHRGSVRARFVFGTAALMIVILVGLIGVVTTHARIRIEEQMHDALRTLVTWNAGMIELNLPEDAETLDLSTLQMGQAFDFDSDTLLQFESLVDGMTDNGLVDFTIADRDDVVLISLDVREIGNLAPELETSDKAHVYSEREGGEWLMHANAPVRTGDDLVVGSIRLTVDAREIQGFLSDLRTTLAAVGSAIILVVLAISWGLSTPLASLFDRLKQRGWRSRFSSRTQLTVAMAFILILLVGALELVAVPIERHHVEDTLKSGLVAAAEWIGQAASESFDMELSNLSPVETETGFFGKNPVSLDFLARLQELTDQIKSDDAAYVALVDDAGTIILSDRFALIGEEVSMPSDTQIEEATWRDEEIWVTTTPLRHGRGGEQVGALRMGVRRVGVETFLDESSNLFRLTGLIAVLAGVLLAQAIGGAVAAPARQLAAASRRIEKGDLLVRLDAGAQDELAILATAYNQMVLGLQEREWLRDMFGRFVSHEVAEAIRAGQVRLEGENRVVSILFCDIRGFTARSEQSTPEEMVALLNEYLPVVVGAAQRHEGTVNKFGGDSTLVVYGAPRRLQESAYQAVLTALEIRAGLRVLNAKLIEGDQDPIRIGVGINTGVALAGAVGPEERQEYAVIGDTVNLATRIEALNKQYPDYDILISGQTYDALGSRRQEFEFVDLGEMQVQDKVEPVRVWAVVR